MLEVKLKSRLGQFDLDLEFQIPLEGITAVVGPSGSGKSSLIRFLAGLERPQEGQIRLGGQWLVDSTQKLFLAPQARRLAVVFQDSRLFPHLSVRQNLLYGAPQGQAPDLLPLVQLLGLAHLLERRPSLLSGGEKQRVALGRAILSRPRLLLMDEPLSGLDLALKQELIPFMAQLSRAYHLPILYVTHAQEEVLALAHQVLVLGQGRVKAQGSLTDLLNQPETNRLILGQEQGSLLLCRLLKQDPQYHLSHLSLAGQELQIPLVQAQVGDQVRLLVKAHEIGLALAKPQASSFQNCLEGRLQEILPQGPSRWLLVVDVGVPLLVSITRQAGAHLGLQPGGSVVLLIKAVSVMPAFQNASLQD